MEFNIKIITYTFSESQEERIRAAIDRAKALAGGGPSEDQERSDAEIIAEICDDWLRTD